MKKLIAVLCIAFLIIFTGCSNEKVLENVVTTTVQSEETVAETEAQMIEIQTEELTTEISTTEETTTKKSEKTTSKVSEKTTEKATKKKTDKTTTTKKVTTTKKTTTTKKAVSKNKCTISISCKTIIDNMSHLRNGKESFVPANGVILAQTTVEFTDGETVFDILKRVCKSNTCADKCKYCQKSGIQLEFSNTPAYNSQYIEGIHQLYEKDCGSMSGWEYKVNNVFPNYGCSLYKVKNGDNIQWLYTCDLGEDIGADF